MAQDQQDSYKLIEDITERAEADRKQVLSEADDKVSEIEQQAEKQIEQLREEERERLENELQTEQDRIVGLAQSEKRNRLLGVRRRLIRETFERAEAQLRETLQSGDYREGLSALIREAVEELGTERCVLSVASQDREAAERSVERLDADVEVHAVGDQPGTVVVETADGLRRIDNSVGTRLNHARRELPNAIAETLFSA